jgi:hypothetical protein
LRGIESYKIDISLTERHSGDVSATLADLDSHIDAALARGGRVILFRALDAEDWRGPVMSMTLAGMTKERIRLALLDHYEIHGPRLVAGFPAWDIAFKARQP